MISNSIKQSSFPGRGTTRTLGTWNTSLILRLLRSSPPLSRAELARRTGLTTPTVSAAVRRLIAQGWVEEVGEGASSGGRRPILLALRPDALYAVGVDLGAARLRLAVLDLRGEVVVEDRGARLGADAQQLLGAVADRVEAALRRAGAARERVLGIGVAVHGLVDPERGLSRFAPHFGWRNVEVARLLQARAGLPVQVDNDARMAALAELTLGAARGAEDALVVSVGEGVGAGLVVGGRLCRGADQGAGEIGHTVVDPDGPRCTCGKYGCLEAIASGPAIARRLAGRVRRGARSRAADLVAGDLSRLTAEVVAQAAALEDREAQRALEEAGRALGIGIANAVNLVNPAKVVLTGGVMRARAWVVPALLEALHQKALDVLSQNVEVGTVGEMDAALGAALQILEGFYDDPARRWRPETRASPAADEAQGGN